MTTFQKNSELSATLPCIFLFFSSMIGHELAMESLSTTYQLFTHLSTSITLFQFGFCVLLPLSISLCTGGDAIQSFPRTFKELWIYIKLSALVYGATACSTMSLTYEGVSYVTKVVFKSAKLIPTMIVGVIMDAHSAKSGRIVKKRKYSAWEYASALLLCLGAAGFCMSPGYLKGGEEEGDSITGEENAKDSNTEDEVKLGGQHWIGILLLTLSVICDALVPNLQQQLMQGISSDSSADSSLPPKNSEDELEMKPLVHDEEGGGGKQTQSVNNKMEKKSNNGLSSQALLVNTNSIGFTLLLLSTIVGRSFIPIVTFLVTHPHFLILHLLVGVGLGTAVLAYTELIRRSGPAVAVAVATLRKVVTILLSYIIFPKPMTLIHVISAGLVVLGLGLSYIGRGRK